jgi:hypothetical protein
MSKSSKAPTVPKVRKGKNSARSPGGRKRSSGKVQFPPAGGLLVNVNVWTDAGRNNAAASKPTTDSIGARLGRVLDYCFGKLWVVFRLLPWHW